MTRNHLIFQIHKAVRTVESRTSLDELTVVAREILKLVAERNFEGHRTRSSDVVQLSGLGTAPTIYSRLSELEEAGWLTSVPDPEDGRSKLLTITPRAEKAFMRMSKELARLSSEASRAAG